MKAPSAASNPPPPAAPPQTVAVPVQRWPWRAVALPAEHGGWGLLAEPLILGLVLAPSPAGAALALAAGAAFLARHPLRLLLADRRRRTRYPRTAMAERVFVGEAILGLALTAAAFSHARAPFWMALVAAVPPALVAVAHDALGRSREALPELAGAVALGGSVTAIALAGGMAPAVAWGAWGLLALRGVVSILYVRARIRLDRGRAALPRAVLALHSIALAATAILAHAGALPWLAAAAFLLLLARAVWGLSPWRRQPLPPKALGFQELAYGIATLVLLALGYSFGV